MRYRNTVKYDVLLLNGKRRRYKTEVNARRYAGRYACGIPFQIVKVVISPPPYYKILETQLLYETKK